MRIVQSAGNAPIFLSTANTATSISVTGTGSRSITTAKISKLGGNVPSPRPGNGNDPTGLLSGFF